MSAEQAPTSPSINFEALSLAPANKLNEVSSKIPVMYQGQDLVIAIPPFHRDGLELKPYRSIKSCQIPLDVWTVENFKVIEAFISKVLPCETYKPLWLNKAMHVNVSNYCTLKIQNADGSVSPSEMWDALGKGTYQFFVHVSHVFVGPHKQGQSCSLSMYVTEIIYQPDILAKPAKLARKRAVKQNAVLSSA